MRQPKDRKRQFRRGHQASRLSTLEGALIYPSAAKAGLPVPTANSDEFDVIQQMAPEGQFIHFWRERKAHCSRKPNQFDCATEFRNELLVFLRPVLETKPAGPRGTNALLPIFFFFFLSYRHKRVGARHKKMPRRHASGNHR